MKIIQIISHNGYIVGLSDDGLPYLWIDKIWSPL